MWFVDVVSGSLIVDVVVAAKVGLVAAREYRSRIMISPMKLSSMDREHTETVYSSPETRGQNVVS